MRIRDRINDFRRVPANELRPNPKNWRTHPKAQQDALRGVLAEIGFAGAVLARELEDGSLMLIDGHARAELTGDAPVPTLVLDVTAEEADKLLATFDPISAMAEADTAKLDALLASVEFESQALNEMLDGLAEDNGILGDAEPGAGGDEFDATPEEGPTRTQPGELWIIGGKHRLIVGDNTDPAIVAKLMGGETVGLCFTSPPYGQQRDYGEKAKEKVQDWHALMCGTFANLPMKEDGQVLVNLGLIHRDGEWVPYWDQWIEWMRSQGWRRFGWYVWDQGSGLPGDWNGRLAPSHEWCFHFNRASVRPDKFVAKKEENVGKRGHGTGMRGKDGTTKGMSSPELCAQPNKIPDSVIRVTRHMARGDEMAHPAVFPVALSEFAINCWPADVYDPFLGSGTTLIAAHRLGRVCYGCEIECRYADVILKRAEAEGLTVERADEQATTTVSPPVEQDAATGGDVGDFRPAARGKGRGGKRSAGKAG